MKDISKDAKIIVLGDFNDYADSPSLKRLYESGLKNITADIKGRNGSPANYRYHGEWHSLDHVLVSPSLSTKVETSYINDASFLLEEEPEYGGKRPRRSFHGFRFQQGYSDHLPLVVHFVL